MTPSQILLGASILATGGPVTLHAGVEASALLPGLDALDIGAATLDVSWADVGDPSTVAVTLSGPLADMLQIRVQEFLDMLTKMRDLTASLEGSIPP